MNKKLLVGFLKEFDIVFWESFILVVDSEAEEEVEDIESEAEDVEEEVVENIEEVVEFEVGFVFVDLFVGNVVTGGNVVTVGNVVVELSHNTPTYNPLKSFLKLIDERWKSYLEVKTYVSSDTPTVFNNSLLPPGCL